MVLVSFTPHTRRRRFGGPQRLSIALALGWLTAVCAGACGGSETQSKAPDTCSGNMVRDCTCPDGTVAQQGCGVTNEWLTCQCAQASTVGDAGCIEGATQGCYCSATVISKQTCTGGVWSACADCPGSTGSSTSCVTGTTLSCLCSDLASRGIRTCDAGVWSVCGNCSPMPDAECVPGQQIGCTCPDGTGDGWTTCTSAGTWGTCSNCGGCPATFECYQTILAPKICVKIGTQSPPQCTTDADCAELGVPCSVAGTGGGGDCMRYCG